MEPDHPFDPSSLAAELSRIQAELSQLANQHGTDSLATLMILRSLSATHARIRDDLFLPNLPSNRHELANILRDMEESGGWPFIERMRLQAFLINLDWQMGIPPDPKK